MADLEVPMYLGMSNLEDHLHAFKIGMEDMTDWADIWCQIFRRMLSKDVIGYLPPGSIYTFCKVWEGIQKATGQGRKGACSTLLNVF